MVTGRTLSLLAIISFIISMIVWNMSEQRNERIRGELLDKISTECSSNIKFLQTGRHDAATKDVTDDVMQEMATGGDNS